MINRRKYKYTAWIIIFCLCISGVKITETSEAAQGKISITEFYNNGVMGEGYEKAIDGAIVTISSVKEMKIFFECLNTPGWTRNISFRQEADISLSNCTFRYSTKDEMIGIYNGNALLGAVDRMGNIFSTFSRKTVTTLMGIGLSNAYIERGWQQFYGSYDGQGFSISGFILTNHDTKHNGIFGHMTISSSVRNLHVKNCFLLNASGVFTGENDGIISDCSTEYLVGLGGQIGGISECNLSKINRCKVSHSTLVNSEALLWIPPRLGGISANLYSGEIKDCAVEDLQIFAYDNVPTSVGGIAGYMLSGKIHDCAGYGSYTVFRNGESCAAGGLVGYLECDSESEISNCVSAGIVAGRLVGGLVGRCGTNANNVITPTIELIKNCVSYSKLIGSISGGLVGSFENGSFTTCYYYDEMANSEMAGQNLAGSMKDCHAVNQSQILGTESADVIDSNSIYSNTPNLLTALNAWVSSNGDYFKWKTGELGYPILQSGLENAPKGDYVLGNNITPTTSSSTPEPSDSPEPVVSNMPEISPSSTPSATPEGMVSPSPTPAEASVPPSPTPETSVPPSATPALPTPSPNQKDEELSKKQLQTKNLNLKLTASLQVKLAWSKNKQASGYQILRSAKKSSGYKIIGTTSAAKLSYTDKKAKRGNTYYYMVRAYGKQGKEKIYGDGQKKKIQVAWYKAPKIELSKGKTSNGKPYVQVKVYGYSGTHIEVYFKTSKKRYIAAPLKNSKIAAYQGKLRFSYSQKSVLYCKVRTYQIKYGKKRYSMFSKEKKIRL